jgi:hypothetical protein
LPALPSFVSTIKIPSRLSSILSFKVTPTFRKDENIFLFGAGANLAADGVIKDGSHYYGKIYHAKLINNRELEGVDYAFKNSFERINKGLQPFEYGSIVYEQGLMDIEELIQENLKRGNKVIYFFPPFAPSVQQKLNSDSYNYMPIAANRLKNISNRYQVPFHDFSNYSSSDSFFIDGFHGGARLYYDLLKGIGVQTKKVVFSNNFETKNDSVYAALRKRIFEKE